MLAISSLSQNPSKFMYARGARDAEDRLIQEVLSLETQRGGDLAALAQPIRIVVPSSSLRKHLSAALVRRAGHSLLGVRLHTLRGTAQRIVEGAEGEPAKSDRLFPLLCRREVAKEPALREALEELEDGFGAVVGTLSDLLDAGLEAPLDEALLESLEELVPASTNVKTAKIKAAKGKPMQAGKSAVLLRAQELVRVAARLGPALRDLGGERTGDLYRRAADCYSRGPECCLPASAIFIFGFSDVTGVAGDLLERLLSYGNTKLILDLPPDPVHPETLDAGTVFAERFAQRFGSLLEDSEIASGQEAGSRAALPAPTLSCFRAPGSRAEVEEVASRIRRLLDSGVAAEEIGVVIRQVGPYASDIRAVFQEQGIPYSAPGELGVMSADGRSLSCLRQVLRHGEQVAVGPWLDVLVSLSKKEHASFLNDQRRELLRVAAHEAGAARLANLAQLSIYAVRLPRSSRGMGLLRKEEDDKVLWQTLRSRPRSEDWSDLLDRAEKCVAFWVNWPDEGSWGEHCEALHHFLADELGWCHEFSPELFTLVLERFTVLASDAPVDWQLARGEALSVFSQLLVEIGEEQLAHLGGEGAGVQVHSVTDARSIGFEHLFLLGLNRDQFPRSIREDPLLPDWLRQPMGQLLPELPLKLKAADEEKYLFAQLLSAASEITLSWQCVDNAGKELALSPLVMRLQIEGLLPETPEISSPGQVERWRVAPEQGSAEVALRHAALYGSRQDFQQLLPLALHAVERELGSAEDISTLAAARFSVLEEMDLDLSSAQGRARQSQVGPYFGFLGRRSAEDPRNNPLYVTNLERFATCPWRSLLESILCVAPPPDALADIPSVDALLLGSMAHEVLEEVARRGLSVRDINSTGEAGVTLRDLLAAEAVPITWPSTKVLDQILAGVVRKAALQLGVPEWEGLLLRRLQPIVERAKELDWAGGSRAVSCLGVEIQDDIVFRGSDDRELLLLFRADRVDRALDCSALCLVDYKSGKSFFKNTTDKGRRSELLKAVANGTKLQATVYALSGEGRTGVYQFLRPDVPVENANFSVQGDEEIEHALQSSVTVLWNGMDNGAYPPRLLDGKGVGASHCDHCSVSEACVKGDSSFRQRLLAALGALSTTDLGCTPALESFQSLWSMSMGDPDASGIPEDRWLSIQHENKGTLR